MADSKLGSIEVYLNSDKTRLYTHYTISASTDLASLLQQPVTYAICMTHRLTVSTGPSCIAVMGKFNYRDRQKISQIYTALCICHSSHSVITSNTSCTAETESVQDTCNGQLRDRWFVYSVEISKRVL